MSLIPPRWAGKVYATNRGWVSYRSGRVEIPHVNLLDELEKRNLPTQYFLTQTEINNIGLNFGVEAAPVQAESSLKVSNAPTQTDPLKISSDVLKDAEDKADEVVKADLLTNPDKDALELYARNKFSYELDKRYGVKKLMKSIEMLENGKSHKEVDKFFGKK